MTPVVGTQRRTIGNDKWATDPEYEILRSLQGKAAQLAPTFEAGVAPAQVGLDTGEIEVLRVQFRLVFGGAQDSSWCYLVKRSLSKGRAVN